jgi:hypothetical protein
LIPISFPQVAFVPYLADKIIKEFECCQIVTEL